MTTGGVNNRGTAFKIKPDGTGYSKMLDFQGATNGSDPFVSSLISDGTFLYGMTYSGGTNNDGTIFKLANATGIAENHAGNDFDIYPNPTSGFFTIKNEKLKMENVEVYNAVGEKIISKDMAGEKSEIDLSSEPKGVYFIKVVSGEFFFTDKIIIE
jgi:uncharacterized repeat protein (TIGR03803 family)